MAIHTTAFESESYDIALCPKCLETLTDPASRNYLDDTLVCRHYNPIELKSYPDMTTFSPHYSEGDTLLVVDSTKVQELFIMTEEEIKALFSIEKPTLKVTIKDETLKVITGKKFLFIQSPYSVRSTLVALNAKESEVPYLFFRPTKALKIVVIQKHITIIEDTKGLAQRLEPLREENSLNRFLNIAKEAQFTKGTIGADLSRTHGITFMVQNEVGSKKVIRFHPFVLSEVLEKLAMHQDKQRLLEHFAQKYPQIIETLQSNPNYGLFETLAAILEVKPKGFEAVSDKALEFRGNGGLQIDAYFHEGRFDYASLIGSVMSFKLGGVEEHFLAYSIFESLGDMTIQVCNQLKDQFKINAYVMMGNMFENSVLYSRILSKFQLANPYFSKLFALDD